jgi:hypothetical protein
MFFFDRLPDNPDITFTDADYAEAVRDNIDVNKDITPEEDRFRQNTELRGTLSRVFTIIIAFWLLSVILILVGNNFKYRLSDNVLITLLTTTTIQVLGMMVIILWDLFPGGKDKKNPKNEAE